jgi:alcohol dehydrogenase class IV
MDSFVYSTLPSRIIFGTGTFKKLPEELERQRLTAPFIVTGPRQIDKVHELASILHSNVAGTFSEAKMHTPVEITEKAMQSLGALKPDCVVSIGGGSAIGLGKAISFQTGLPHICLPTTYSGSETTTHLGETENGVKLRKADPKILPGTVIYDVDLTLTLPASMSATSGVNAIAHAGIIALQEASEVPA